MLGSKCSSSEQTFNPNPILNYTSKPDAQGLRQLLTCQYYHEYLFPQVPLEHRYFFHACAYVQTGFERECVSITQAKSQKKLPFSGSLVQESISKPWQTLTADLKKITF